MGVRVGRAAVVATAGALLAALPLVGCARGAAVSTEQRVMGEALQTLRDAGSYRMTGEIRTADGTATPVDARVDGRGNCRGTVGRADSILIGDRVWTHWKEADLPELVRAIRGGTAKGGPGGPDSPGNAVAGNGQGGPSDPGSPVEDTPQSRAWEAEELLYDAYLETDLPGGSPEVEGIAPACKAGGVLAAAGGGSDIGGDVVAGPEIERDGVRVRPLSRVTGPVTLKVYVTTTDAATLHRAEYTVDGGRTVSVRFTELGRPVTVAPPLTSATVSARHVLELLA